MINKVAFRDQTIFNLYEPRAATTPPTTVDTAATLLRSILMSRMRSEEYEQASSGKQSLLASSTTPPPPQPPSDTVVSKTLALLTKLEPNLSAIFDPNKRRSAIAAAREASASSSGRQASGHAQVLPLPGPAPRQGLRQEG